MEITQVLQVLERWGILGFASIILCFAGWLIKYTLDANSRREHEHAAFIGGEMKMMRDTIMAHDQWEHVVYEEVKEVFRRNRNEHDRIEATLALMEPPFPPHKGGK